MYVYRNTYWLSQYRGLMRHNDEAKTLSDS